MKFVRSEKGKVCSICSERTVATEVRKMRVAEVLFYLFDGMGKRERQEPPRGGRCQRRDHARPPTRPRTMAGGPSRGSDLVGRKFQFGYFLGGIFGGIFLRGNSLFIFYF